MRHYLLAFALSAWSTPLAGEPVLPDLETLEGHPVCTVLPPDALPAIDRPRIAAAGEAGFMDDGEPVLGVAVGGRPRAYALGQLDWHEVVNDRLGGRPIAVTW